MMLSLALAAPALAGPPGHAGGPNSSDADARGDVTAPQAQPEHTRGPRGQAPLVGLDHPDRIDGEYIVVFESGAAASDVSAARAQVRGQGGRILHAYDAALTGFAAELPAQALGGLRNNPNVAYIEANAEVQLANSQSPATWGLDRIDQRNLPLNNTYNYDFTGDGVDIYILDTGIHFSHVEFGGRALHGYSAYSGGSGDCHGHGSHVAGTAGGSVYGVAKDATLYSVRVLSCTGSGTLAGIIGGINWVTNNASGPSVANMSLGGGFSSSHNQAVANSVASGVTYAVAAGNSNANACNFSPASVSTALTVGSTDSNDNRSSFSNWGSCVDIFAPGRNITAAWHTSNTALNTISGTSMASPHVAGVAALYLEDNPGASPAQVHSAITGNATSGVVGNPGSGSPNLLLYSLFNGGGGPGPGPGVPCQYDESYGGSLSQGQTQQQPNGTYYQSSAGTHYGCVIGPQNTIWDLYLYRWNGWNWQLVASAINNQHYEDIQYTGPSGFYTWLISAWQGGGSYSFTMTRP